MTRMDAPPIACTLGAADLKQRLAWIAELNRDALRSATQHDLMLDLRFAPEAADRVREMVQRERACCGFLTFALREEPHEVCLMITAPDEAREAVAVLFQQFVAPIDTNTVCGCRRTDASHGDR